MALYSPIIVARFWSKVDVKTSDEECWPWIAGTRGGYGFMKVNGRSVTASRIAWELFSGEKLGSRFALHDCDNRLCCNPRHIHPGDHDQNMQEAVERQRFRATPLKGEKNPRAKLSESDVRRIRSMFTKGMNNVQIAAKFGVTHSMISRIRTGRSW